MYAVHSNNTPHTPYMALDKDIHDGVGELLSDDKEESEHHIMQSLIIMQVRVLCQQPQDHTLQLVLSLPPVLLCELCKAGNVTTKLCGCVLPYPEGSFCHSGGCPAAPEAVPCGL